MRFNIDLTEEEASDFFDACFIAGTTPEEALEFFVRKLAIDKLEDQSRQPRTFAQYLVERGAIQEYDDCTRKADSNPDERFSFLAFFYPEEAELYDLDEMKAEREEAAQRVEAMYNDYVEYAKARGEKPEDLKHANYGVDAYVQDHACFLDDVLERGI